MMNPCPWIILMHNLFTLFKEDYVKPYHSSSSSTPAFRLISWSLVALIATTCLISIYRIIQADFLSSTQTIVICILVFAACALEAVLQLLLTKSRLSKILVSVLSSAVVIVLCAGSWWLDQLAKPVSLYETSETAADSSTSQDAGQAASTLQQSPEVSSSTEV